MKDNTVVYRTSTCNICYYVVWVVKHRRTVLNGEAGEYLKEVIKETAQVKGFMVTDVICMGDHVECFVTAPPKLSVTDIVRYLKGISGRKMLEKFPELVERLDKGELWNHSYYCGTVGSISHDAVTQYLKQQEKAY